MSRDFSSPHRLPYQDQTQSRLFDISPFPILVVVWNTAAQQGRSSRMAAQYQFDRLVTNPSSRNPRLNTRFNDADEIDRGLRRYGHHIWGFVIFRCTYDNDTEWDEFMRRLRGQLYQTLEYYGGLDLMTTNPFTVFADRMLLDGASTSTVRQYFLQWAHTAPLQEQGVPSASVTDCSPRYRICIQVDSQVLRSVVDDVQSPLLPEYNDGFINVVRGDWPSQLPSHTLGSYVSSADDEGEDDIYEAIEGNTEHDVGWMRIKCRDQLGFYCFFQSNHGWDREYRRPPEVVEG